MTLPLALRAARAGPGCRTIAWLRSWAQAGLAWELAGAHLQRAGLDVRPLEDEYRYAGRRGRASPAAATPAGWTGSGPRPDGTPAVRRELDHWLGITPSLRLAWEI